MTIGQCSPYKRRMDRPLMLWCSSHFSLANEEIPLYLEAGFRVVPLATDMWTFQYQPDLDHLLCDTWKASAGLPADVIHRLQAIRMYQDSGRNPLQDSDIEILNQYVDVIYLTILPNLIPKLTQVFDGSVVFRPFGHVQGQTYSNVLKVLGGDLDGLRGRYNYIWCPILRTLQDPEDARLWANPLHVGCFVSDERLGHKRWKADRSDPVLVETIPRIHRQGYYYDVYKSYIADFGELPLSILGGNPPGGAELDDPRIVGRLDDEQYQDRIISSRLAIYHGREPGHLHYHPIEYMSMGVPVLFHANSALAAEAREFGISEMELHEMGMYAHSAQALAMAREGLSDWRIAAGWSQRQRFFITEIFDRDKALNEARWLRTVCTNQLRQIVNIKKLALDLLPRSTSIPPATNPGETPVELTAGASTSKIRRRWTARVRREISRFSQKVRRWATGADETSRAA